MKVLIIGGTGFISGAVARHLLARGYTVTAITRGSTPPPAEWSRSVEWLAADRSDTGRLATAVGNRTFDAVFDMVAYEPEATRNAVRILKGATGRFIHCSTVSVYMVSADACCPVTEDQDSLPLMPEWPRNPFGMDYGVRKRECEEVLWEHHHPTSFPVSMLRPTFVSGPGDPARRDWFWMQRMLDGQPLLVPGSGDFAFQQVYVEDVARMFVRLLDEPHSIGQAYNIAGEEIFSLKEYLRRLGSLLGCTPELVPIHQEDFDARPLSWCPDGDVFPFNTRRTAVFSLDRIKNDLGYKSTPWETWMSETAAWWQSPERPDSYGWSRRGEEIALAAQLKNRKATQ